MKKKTNCCDFWQKCHISPEILKISKKSSGINSFSFFQFTYNMHIFRTIVRIYPLSLYTPLKRTKEKSKRFFIHSQRKLLRGNWKYLFFCKTKTAIYDKGKMRTVLWNEEGDKKRHRKLEKNHRITTSVSISPFQ